MGEGEGGREGEGRGEDPRQDKRQETRQDMCHLLRVLFLSARNSLPMGPPVLFDEETPCATPLDPKTNRLQRCFGEDREPKQNMADSMESIFAQFMLLAAFPSADYIFSNFHAGQGCKSRSRLLCCCCGTRESCFSLSLLLSRHLVWFKL